MDLTTLINLELLMGILQVDPSGLVVGGVSLGALVTWLTNVLKARTTTDPKTIAWGLSIIFAILIAIFGEIPVVAEALKMLALAAGAWVSGTGMYKLGLLGSSSNK